jgi:hypothetical protein
MGRNLTNLAVSESFQYLLQYSGSNVQDGLGNNLTGSLLITASLANTANTASYVLNAVSSSFATSASQAINANTAISSSFSTTATSASYALTSTSSSFAINATSASYATNALSASFATTASYALNAGTTVSTASLLTTASAVANVITFTKGDGSTFPVTIATGSAVSSSYASTASLALNNVLTASSTDATITYTKGDGTTFNNVINNVVNANSASVATSASFATTASFASTIADGLSPTFANVTASNVLITGTASVALLYTQTISSSVIYSSGSNQFGDASNDVQTLYGTVDVKNGPLLVSGSTQLSGSTDIQGGDFKVTDQNHNGEFDVDAFKVKTITGTTFTGSVSSQNGFTGSLQGTASFANNATSASYALSASFAPSSPAFPFTGSARITGSLSVTGSNTTDSNPVISWASSNLGEYGVLAKYGSGVGVFSGRSNSILYLGTLTGGQQNLITLGGGGGVGFFDLATAANSPYSFFNNSTGATFRYPLTISSSLTVTGSVVSILGFTGSLLGTASFANNVVSASFANNATSASFAATASFLLGSIASASYATFAVTSSYATDFTIANTASINVLEGNVTASLVRNTADTYTTSPKVNQIVTLTQAEYNSIGSPDANTLYIISGSTPFNPLIYATTGSNTFIGNQTISGSLDVQSGITGSLLGTSSFATTASYAINAATASFLDGTVASASFASTASFVVTAQTASFFNLSAVTQNAVFSGSVRGEVENKTYTSNTASIDLSTGNFFTTTLGDGVANYINFTNINPGQTINLRVTNGAAGNGTVSFPSSVKQVSGSAYVPTATPNAVDIVTFISFDSTNLYLSNIKNFV